MCRGSGSRHRRRGRHRQDDCLPQSALATWSNTTIGHGNTTCTNRASDDDPTDLEIMLTELLHLIQFFNRAEPRRGPNVDTRNRGRLLRDEPRALLKLCADAPA